MNLKEFGKYADGISNLADLKQRLNFYFDNKKIFLSQGEIEKKIYDESYEWFAKNHKKKIWSLKTRKKFEKEKFRIIDNERKTNIFYHCKLDKKKNFYCDYHEFNFLSTKSGILYFLNKLEEYDLIISFFSHFFDRFNQRELSLSSTRIETIEKFMDFFIHGHGRLFLNNKYEMHYFIDGGLIIGYGTHYKMENGEPIFIEPDGDPMKYILGEEQKDIITFLSFQTYVDNEKLRPEQIDMLNSIK